MILNSEDIRALNLISENFKEDNLKECSYDITVGDILNGNKEVVKETSIPVNGLVVLSSNEKITLPKGIVGLAHIKTKLSQEGLLAINTGIIDPTYNGFLSTVLINYGSKEYPIKAGCEILRITFHRINHNETPKILPNNTSKDYESYLDSIFRRSRNLNKTFVNENLIIDKSKTNALNALWKQIVIGGLIVSSFAAIFGFVLSERTNQYYIDTLEKRVDKQNEDIKKQKIVLDSLKNSNTYHKEQSTNASHKGK